MTGQLTVRRTDGAILIGPPAAVRAVDSYDRSGAPPVVLSVYGGVLLWPWHIAADGTLDAERTLAAPPVAIIDDEADAEGWLWAVYGSAAAIALADGGGDADWDTPNPDVVARAARVGFGLWLSVWWPGSVLDGIPALDLGVLFAELGPLSAQLDPLCDVLEMPSVGERVAARFALAAGAGDDADAAPIGAHVTTGYDGIRWSLVPAGWVDASERAVTWRLEQELAGWRLRVRVAAGAQPPRGAAVLHAAADDVTITLELGRDDGGACWQGEAAGDGRLGAGPVRVWAGLLAADPDEAGELPAWQQQVRAFARSRLGDPAPSPALWQAEAQGRRDADL